MFQGEEKVRPARQAADDLEPYRRLIELQKQMIDLVQKREQALRDCELLRDQMARESAWLMRPRQNLGQRVRRSTTILVIKAVSLGSRIKISPRRDKMFAASRQFFKSLTPN